MRRKKDALYYRKAIRRSMSTFTDHTGRVALLRLAPIDSDPSLARRQQCGLVRMVLTWTEVSAR